MLPYISGKIESELFPSYCNLIDQLIDYNVLYRAVKSKSALSLLQCLSGTLASRRNYFSLTEGIGDMAMFNLCLFLSLPLSATDSVVEVDVTTRCFRGQGEGYRGSVAVTPSGVICQRWDSQYPHNHSYVPQNYRCK